MDYRALGEFVFMALIGLSVLGVVTTLSFHFVLRPFLERVLVGRREQGALDQAVERRLQAVESRLLDLSGEVEALRAARDFDRRLEAAGTPEEKDDGPSRE